MSSHPLNLALRFALEMAAVFTVGRWGWVSFTGVGRWAAVIGLPLIFMAIWGTFAVPDDPSRSGTAPVPVPGMLRLCLELSLFGVAAWATYHMHLPRWALGLAGLVAAHYALSWDRIRWLLDR